MCAGDLLSLVVGEFRLILADALSRPETERPVERVQVLIAEQIGNVLGRERRVAQIVFGEQLARVVELLLKAGVFLFELALQRAAAQTERAADVVDRARAARSGACFGRDAPVPALSGSERRTGGTRRRHGDLTIGRDLCIITTKSLIFCEICPPASGDREESNVTYTVDDTMKKLLGAPEAVAVLERFFPKILKNPALQMTAAMTLRQVAGFAQSGLTADSLAEIDAQLRALPSSDG